MAAAAEVARVHDEHGFLGVFAGPNPILGRNLDDPVLRPGVGGAVRPRHGRSGCTRAACRRSPRRAPTGSPTPSSGTSARTRWSRWCAAVSLIYGGVLERFPGARGWRSSKPGAAGCRSGSSAWTTTTRRASNATSAPPSCSPCRRATTSAGSASCRPTPTRTMLEQVIAVLGDDRIVFSTDYPHPDSKYPHAVDSFLALAGRERRAASAGSSGTTPLASTTSTNSGVRRRAALTVGAAGGGACAVDEWSRLSSARRPGRPSGRSGP